MKDKPCSVEHTRREIIENQLLVSLEDKSKVALLLGVEDLDLLIEGLSHVNNLKSGGMMADLMQLRKLAFKELV